MSKSIHCFKLPFKIKETLVKHRLAMSGDLSNLSIEQLSKITHLSLDECEEVVKVINNKESLYFDPASILLKRELAPGSTIPTLSAKLNNLLCDGFPLGRLCEIAGASGVGKTQICFQLCVTVQLPEDIGGLGADSLYIDVDNSFRFNRIAEISGFLREKTRNMIDFDEERISEHIFVERCEELSHLQVLVLEKLEPFIKQNPQVRLVIIDSIAYLLRYDFKGKAEERNALIWNMSNKLREIAATYNLCVIVTNHVRYEPESGKEKPALGNRWGHYCALRLFLEKHAESGVRVATLTKSVNQQEASIHFKIGPQGVYDAEEPIERATGSRNQDW
ncbi:DNA repair protein RAD51 homolog 3-like [Tetranychus urticae]|uniref:DNA repair protein RAD51 homolog 3-like n=1 Tax=Tetranychus urticae TaxID=32264 RepID=UPI00077BE67A|nr:DNA repair protein RAD51 homolog 3-like [Tetranychus urticae]